MTYCQYIAPYQIYEETTTGYEKMLGEVLLLTEQAMHYLTDKEPADGQVAILLVNTLSWPRSRWLLTADGCPPIIDYKVKTVVLDKSFLSVNICYRW